MTALDYVPDTGDLISTDFDPTRGREPGGAGRRLFSLRQRSPRTPASPLCAPSPRRWPFPTSVVLPGALPIAGEILTSHIRSIDTQAQPVHFAGAAVAPGDRATGQRRAQGFITI